MTKNVATALCASSASSTAGVVRDGPSSNVSAIVRRLPAPHETSRGSVSPPARVHLRVARPRVRRAAKDDLRALRPALEVAHRLLRDPDGVPRFQLENLVVELQACTSLDHDVHLFLFGMRMPERNAEVRCEAEEADPGVLELEGGPARAVLHLGRQFEFRRLVLDLLLEVEPGVVRHRNPPCRRLWLRR